jgi:hypothetical protein
MRRFLPATLLLVLAATLTACPPAAVAKPVIKSFTSNVPSDKLPVGGGDVILSWATTGADKVNLAANPASPVPVLGADNLTATVTGVKVETTFTLTATNSAGDTVTATKKITVTAATIAPTITTFQVKTGAGAPGPSVNLPPAGGSVTFNWAVSDATGLSIDNGVPAITPFAATGTKDFTVPAGTTPITFKLTASGATGSTPATATVIVNRNADTVPPSLDASTPANAAPGIDKAANIIVTFSEAMNQAATQAAYSSTNAEIAPGNVAFTWNAAGTVLTINPNGDLLYDAITTATGLAKVYTYKFGAGATDLAGNPLAAASMTDRTFKTKRDITLTIVATEALGGEVIYNVAGTFNAEDPDIEPGDTATGNAAGANEQYKGFIGFDITAVPAADVAAGEAVTASMTFDQYDAIGTPYAAIAANPAGGLGGLIVDHITYTGATRDLWKFSAYAAGEAIGGAGTKHRTISTLTDATLGVKTLDVKVAILEDLANKVARFNRSTYRLAFTKATNGNSAENKVRIHGAGASAPKLTLKYILP